MLIHWIWLAQRQQLTDWEKVMLLQHFGDPEDIYHADVQTLCSEVQLRREAVEELKDRDLSQAQEILNQCSRQRIGIVTFQDATYPVRLKHIADPPLVLYYKGILPDFDSVPVIGIVGTRKASAYGMQTAKQMGHQIGRCGGLVVSGLADGVDAMAMIGALSAGSPVVGVLGCGIDIVYPKTNRALFADTERYGCILSEFLPGTPPYRWNFLKRNRIISGLSCGVLVVEAPARSGALNSARHALDQGRDVFVIPGNIDNPACAGSNQLLREGAAAAFSGWDILREYEALYPGKIQKIDLMTKPERHLASEEKPAAKVAQKAVFPDAKEDLQKDADKKVIDKGRSGPYSDVNDILPKLSEEERKVVSALLDGQRLVDDVISETGMTTGKILAILTMLELKKVIVRYPGKRIGLK